jgi:DNA repair and recombination protein RAD54B
MATLYDSDSKVVGKTRLAPSVASTLAASVTLDVSRNDVEIMAPASKEEFDSRKATSSTSNESTKDTPEPPGMLKYAPKGTLPTGSLKSTKSLSKDSRRLARYDPDAPGAFVLFRPPVGSDEVAVVLEPRIASKMRPHQLEGVKFMYECVNGLRNIPEGGMGCILADEMVRSPSCYSIWFYLA